MPRRGTPPPHGCRRRYAYWRCRCPLCREAERVYAKRHREQRAESEFVDPTGTVRRIRGLVALGYAYTVIGAHLGTTDSWICQLARANGSRGVLRRTADEVEALCRRLVELPPPTGRNATYARTVARKHGWHSFAVWDDIDDPDAQPNLGGDGDDICDEVVVRRALAGQMPFSQLRPPERIAVYHQLVAEGAGPAAIRRRLNINGFVLLRLEALARQETAEACEVAA